MKPALTKEKILKYALTTFLVIANFAMFFFIAESLSKRFGLDRGVAAESVLDRIYVGGSFTTPGSRIGYLQDGTWYNMGTGVNDTVNSIEEYDATGDIYVGGRFTEANGSTVNYIAKWDGSSWSALGSGVNNYVNYIEIDQDTGDLYAAGNFTEAGGSTVNYIAKWDGSSWSEVGSGGASAPPMGLYFDEVNDDLYASFGSTNTTVGGVTVNYYGKWNGTSWSNVGRSDLGGSAYNGSMFYDSSGNQLYGAGYYDTNRTKKGMGSSWSNFGGTFDNSVYDLVKDSRNGDIYVAGAFTNGIFEWNGSSWAVVGGGRDNRVADLSLGIDAGTFYAGGKFTEKVSYWNGSSWEVVAGASSIADTITQIHAVISEITATVDLSVDDNSVSENGGVSTVTATMSQTLASDVTVNLSYGGTATNVDDYTRSGTSITITAGNTTGTATITGVDDSSYEGNETVIVDIDSVSGGASENGTQQVTVTLEEDESPPTVSLGVSPSSLDEDGGTSTVTATLSESSSLDTTVNLAYSGTATNTTDYTRSGASIIITAGNTTGTVTLTGVNDSDIDPDETVIVDIDSVVNGTENGTQSVTATIADDEAPPTITLSVDDNSIAENGGVAIVTATINLASTQDISVNLGFAGTATNLLDYTRDGTSMVITAGNTTDTITLTGVNNDLDEENKTVVVSIESVTGASEAVPQEVTVTLEDDDVIPNVTLSVDDDSVSEDGGVATITATLAEAGTQDAVINLAYGGTAAGGDYNASSSTINISSGSTTGTVTVTGVNDVLDEDNETVIVSISSVTGAVEATEQSKTVTLEDDDDAPTVTLSTNNESLSEAGGTATLTATLSAVSGKDVTVNLLFSGTASAGSDYTSSSSVITVSAGSSTGTTTVTAINDTVDDDSEAIVADISTVSNATESGTQNVSMTIADDDDPAPTTQETTEEEEEEEVVEEVVEEEETPAEEETQEPVVTTTPEEEGLVEEDDMITIDGEVVLVSEVVYEGEEMEFEEENVEPVTEEDGIEVGIVIGEDSKDVKTRKKLSGSTLHVSQIKEIEIAVPVLTLEGASDSAIESVTVSLGDVFKTASLDEERGAYVASIEVDTSAVIGESVVSAKIVTQYADGETMVKGIHFVVEGPDDNSILVIKLEHVIYAVLVIVVAVVVWFVIKMRSDKGGKSKKKSKK